MWIPPLVYAVVSILLWQFAHVFFMPQAIANRLVSIQTAEPLVVQIVLANVSGAYFGAYWAFSANWKRLRPYLKNEFLAGFVLWAVNVLIVFPLIGRGVFGYKLPQGAFSPCFFLVVTHWVYARMLQLRPSGE